jgi:hypothetical protein
MKPSEDFISHMRKLGTTDVWIENANDDLMEAA